MNYNILSQKEMGRYLRYYRMRAGYTAQDISGMLGFSSQQSIFNIESGKTPISTTKLYALLDICNVPRDQAFTEPYEIVDNPTRVKRTGSVRAKEMMEVFRQIDADGQRTLLKMAKWILAAQGAKASPREDENS